MGPHPRLVWKGALGICGRASSWVPAGQARPREQACLPVCLAVHLSVCLFVREVGLTSRTPRLPVCRADRLLRLTWLVLENSACLPGKINEKRKTRTRR